MSFLCSSSIFAYLPVRLLRLATMTQAAKLKLMIVNYETGIFCNPFIKLFINRFRQVKDLSTTFTSEMVMIILAAFIPAYGAAEIQLRDFSSFRQYFQVPIDSSLADIRYQFSDLFVYPIGSRMRMRAANYM